MTENQIRGLLELADTWDETAGTQSSGCIFVPAHELREHLENIAWFNGYEELAQEIAAKLREKR